MRILLLATILLAATLDFTLAGAPEASQKIDELLARQHTKMNVRMNAPISDETFLRRIYLDVMGRIPTLAEACAFLDSDAPDKRAKLIGRLLDSEGYVSHSFNYWADVLRISETVGNNRLQTYVYTLWLKDALRRNLPFDRFVWELITARGFLWENGATGYYHRDRGMPLDNMSNTIRIFLGTRLECAQCHNHPFDRWTQMDYYRMAAFSHEMDARIYIPRNRVAANEYKSRWMEEVRAAAGGTLDPGSREYLKYKALGQVIADLFARLKYIEVRETPDTLTLPHDYQYDDAAPESAVLPATMFGREIGEKNSVDERVTAYADWMTSPENPRFTRVIANRLWKRAMGRGLVEPIDEFTGDTEASVPELLDYLENRLISLGYDTKAFLAEIYNTRAYQSEATRHDLFYGEPYYFTGPVLRRLSAEQIWDSLVTLAIANPDYYMPKLNVRLSQIELLRQIYVAMEGRTEAEIIQVVQDSADSYTDTYEQNEQLTRELLDARARKEDELAAKLAKELNSLRSKRQSALRQKAYQGQVKGGNARELYAVFGIGGDRLPLEKLTRNLPKNPGITKESYAAWRKEAVELMRASEMPKPAPRGHFLREFGQSDREVIDNANRDGTVPQALSLLNGPWPDLLGNPSSALRANLAKAAGIEGQLETLFLTILSRRPTSGEVALFRPEFERIGSESEAAVHLVIWTLVNSQQFRFAS